jgi:hypothetical protein
MLVLIAGLEFVLGPYFGLGTGRPPNQHVLARRFERAQQLASVKRVPVTLAWLRGAPAAE